LKPYIPSELRTKVSVLSDLYLKNEELQRQVVELNGNNRELNKQIVKLKAELDEVLLDRT